MTNMTETLTPETSKRNLVNRGGRPAVLKLCPHCAEPFSTMLLRIHIPRCPDKKFAERKEKS